MKLQSIKSSALSFAVYLALSRPLINYSDSSTAAGRIAKSHYVICWNGISGAQCQNTYGCGCSEDGDFYDGGDWPDDGHSCTRFAHPFINLISLVLKLSIIYSIDLSAMG
ncbi:hypothetical protein GcM1_246134 [Golovinomyces cichoracearum]|uniref:Uncharacterized protein n=1 Tax=Golovinomyces cichoracearum TaxID=62708 RepID=A0A420IEI3_9PEZI|nr:hypothetical protein GcM1_246134 [Golovinomyces cichoracearum]